MDGRQELFAYLGSTVATIVVLFGAQAWYESYLDVDVVHAQHLDAPLDSALSEVRAQEAKKLDSGRLPVARAMREIAQRGRDAFPLITPKPSDDLSPMSGWIRKPGFAAYVPWKAAPTPAAPAAPVAEGEQAGGAGAEVASAEGAGNGAAAAGETPAAGTPQAPTKDKDAASAETAGHKAAEGGASGAAPEGKQP